MQVYNSEDINKWRHTYVRFVSIPYTSSLSKTYFLLHPLPTVAPLICLPYLGLHSTSLQPGGELLLWPAQPSAGARKKRWRRAGRERVKKTLSSRSTPPPCTPPPPRQDPAPSTTQSWPRDVGLRGTGVQGCWWDDGAAPPAPGRASWRRRRGHRHAEPLASPWPARWLLAVALTAPTHKSPRPQLPVLTPAPPSLPAPFPPLQRGQRSGAPRIPHHSPREGCRCCWLAAPQTQPGRGRPGQTVGTRAWASPERALSAKVGAGGKGRRSCWSSSGSRKLSLKNIHRRSAVEQPPGQSSMWTGSPGSLSALWLPLPPPPPSEQLLSTAGAPRGARSRDARTQRPLLTAGRFISGGGNHCCCWETSPHFRGWSPGEELRLYTSRPEPTWLVTWSSVRDISAMGTTGALKESSEGPSARMDLPLR